MAEHRYPHTPFLRPQKRPDMEGVYRLKETGDICVVRNVWFKGMIDQDDVAYDTFVADVHSTKKEIGCLKKAIIEHLEDWEYLLPLK